VCKSSTVPETCIQKINKKITEINKKIQNSQGFSTNRPVYFGSATELGAAGRVKTSDKIAIKIKHQIARRR
ncbi:24764_t:CDS:1, partial [Gigaspora margarita]